RSGARKDVVRPRRGSLLDVEHRRALSEEQLPEDEPERKAGQNDLTRVLLGPRRHPALRKEGKLAALFHALLERLHVQAGQGKLRRAHRLGHRSPHFETSKKKFFLSRDAGEE